MTRRLMDALCNEGADARMLVIDKGSDSLRIAEVASNWKARFTFLAEHADILTRNGFKRDTLFKISTAQFGLPLLSHPWVVEADAIILNWVNQGMASLREIKRIADLKPVIWTMHDQWNMTGVCHYTDGCENRFTDRCRNCPLLPKGSKLANKVFNAKERLYRSTNIRFVAVSNRLAEMCSQSPLMSDAKISVIPNAFPTDKFGITPAMSRQQLRLPEERRLIVMGAARLDNPVKNLPLAIDSLNIIADSHSSENLFAVFFGQIRNPKILARLKMPHASLGPITNHQQLQSLLAHSAVVMSTSLWETLPGTIVEGISCGAAAVATSNGGQTDIITPDLGYIAPHNEPRQIAQAISSALTLPDDIATRQYRHRAMTERFGAPAVARAYLRLIRSALKL